MASLTVPVVPTRSTVPRADRHPRVMRVALALGLIVGTLVGVVATSVLALLLGAPRLVTTGLEPAPTDGLWGWLVSPEVSRPATRAMLWLLGILTVVLAAAIARASRRVWRVYAAWAVTGGLLALYAMLANWSLAPEAGLVALVIGGAWSGFVALALRYAVRHDFGPAGERT